MEYQVKDLIKPCIYFLKKEGEIVYVGSSEHGVYRALSHKIINSKKEFDTIELIECEEKYLTEQEAHYILMYDPLYNRSLPATATYTSLQGFLKGYYKNGCMDIPQLKRIIKERGIKSVGVFNCQVYFRTDELIRGVSTYE